MGWIAVASTIAACVGTALIDPLLFPQRGTSPADESDSVSLLQQTVEVQKGQKPMPGESLQARPSKRGSTSLGASPENSSCAEGQALGVPEVKQQTWTDLGAVAQQWQRKQLGEAIESSLTLAAGEPSLASLVEMWPDLEVENGSRAKKKSPGKGGITRSEIVFFCIFFAVMLGGVAVRELWCACQKLRDEKDHKQPSGSIAPSHGRLMDGMRVVVAQPFVSDSEPSVLIQKGETGVIQKVEGQGDLLVRFDNHDMLQWVFRHSFHKLVVRSPGEVFSGRLFSKA